MTDTLSFTLSATNDPTTGGKQEQILRGAMQVFLQQGYAATSMDRVAAEAGVSKHTIYSHFQAKEGLFTALIERLILRHFEAEFGPVLVAGESPDYVLRRIGEIMLGRMDDPEYIAFVRLMIAESERFPELAQLYMGVMVKRGHTALSEYLTSHPELQLPDPEAAARVFCGSLAAFVISQGIMHGSTCLPMDRTRYLNGLLGLFLRG